MTPRPRGPLARARSLVDTSHGNWSGWRRGLVGQAAYLSGALDRFVQVDPGRVRRLVFVCLGNINRSPFAEAAARKAGARVASLGLKTSTGAPASDLAIRLGAGFGIDLATHAATDVTDHEPEPGDLLLVHETRHVDRLIDLGTAPGSIALLGAWASPLRVHLHDPQGLSEAYHRTCFALIHSAVGKLTDELAAGDSPCMRFGPGPGPGIGRETR